ncbi:MAG: hypothetical protein LBS85_04110, partial [Clostridiales Family XIII bacterium]|nr:hypothetical protein [Clostridiales Family XIII bacterium]
VDYSVGVGGGRVSDIYPKNFVMVDLLPPDMQYVSVTPTTTFQSSVGANIQVVDDYQNTGRTAVVFTADELRLNSSGVFSWEQLATIRARKGPMDTEGSAGITNDVYMRADSAGSAGFALEYTEADPFNTKLNGGAALSHDQVVMRTLRATQFVIQKEIRTGTEPFSLDGVETARSGAFDYRYNIYNMLTTSRDHVVIYDIFPYAGDTRMDTDTQGLIPSRGSEFSDTLADWIDAGQFPGGTTIYYTADPNAVTTRDYLLNDTNWTTTRPASLSLVRGFKIVLPESYAVAANGVFRFIVKMRAPADPAYALTNRLAWNSFAVEDSLTVGMSPSPVESNKVWNKIPQAHVNIGAWKVGEEVDGVRAPLANALFALVNLNTNQTVKTAYSDQNGRVYFADVPAANYAIRELSAPAGYVRTSAELSVTENELMAFFELGAGGAYEAGTIENEKTPPPRTYGNLQLLKNSTSGSVLAGAVFRVTGQTPAGDAKLGEYGNLDVIVTRVSNNAGEVNFRDLPVGDYLLEEISAPGHLVPGLPAGGALVTVSADATTLYPAGGAAILNNKAAFTLVKIGIFSDTFKGLRNDQLDAVMGLRLGGVGFTLHTGGASGPEAGSGTTDAQGEITFGDLDVGVHYTLAEDAGTLPSGLALRQGLGPDGVPFTGDDPTGLGIFDVLVDIDGALWIDGHKVSTSNLIVGNDGNANDFRAVVLKTDQYGNPLPGATFRVRLSSAASPNWDLVTDAAGQIVLTDAILRAMAVSHATASNTYFDAFLTGTSSVTLRLTETAAPAGSIMPSPAPAFNFAGNGGYQVFTATNLMPGLDLYKYTVVGVDTEETLQYLGLANILERIRGGDDGKDVQYSDLTASDLDEIAAAAGANPALRTMVIGGTEIELRMGLAGAVIRVYRSGYESTSNTADSFTGTTDANGQLHVTAPFVWNASYTYVVKEITPPAGYKHNSVEQTFVISNLAAMSGFDGTVHVSLENVPQLGALHVTKLTSRNGTPLQGAVFSLERTDGTGGILSKTTDVNGAISFTGLAYGDYYLQETEPAPGYTLNTDRFRVTISAEESTVYRIIYNDDTITKREEGSLRAAKAALGDGAETGKYFTFRAVSVGSGEPATLAGVDLTNSDLELVWRPVAGLNLPNSATNLGGVGAGLPASDGYFKLK